jgi:hypothetical protein
MYHDACDAYRNVMLTCSDLLISGARHLIRSGLSAYLTSTITNSTTLTMPITSGDLEAAVRAAIQVTHINVEDRSNGCGNSYFVLIVSKVVDIIY